MPCVYTNPCVSIVTGWLRHRLSENRLDHRALPAPQSYQRMPDFRRRFLQVCVKRSTAELQCASHTLRKRKAANDSYRIFLPRYHFHDDRIVWGYLSQIWGWFVTFILTYWGYLSQFCCFLQPAWIFSYFLNLIFKEAKFEGSLSQLISFSFLRHVTWYRGLVRHHWWGLIIQFITLNWLSACVPLPGVFPRWIFLLALSVRAIWQNSSSLFLASSLAMLGYTAAASASDKSDWGMCSSYLLL